MLALGIVLDVSVSDGAQAAGASSRVSCDKSASHCLHILILLSKLEARIHLVHVSQLV